MRSPCTATKSSPCLLQLEKTWAQQRRPNAAKKKKKKKVMQPPPGLLGYSLRNSDHSLWAAWLPWGSHSVRKPRPHGESMCTCSVNTLGRQPTSTTVWVQMPQRVPAPFFRLPLGTDFFQLRLQTSWNKPFPLCPVRISDPKNLQAWYNGCFKLLSFVAAVTAEPLNHYWPGPFLHVSPRLDLSFPTHQAFPFLGLLTYIGEHVP